MKVTSVSKARPARARLLQLSGGLMLSALLAFSCQRGGEEPTGGETHFLTRCDASAAACGQDFACVCGVCSRPCSEQSTCQDLPAARCTAKSDGVMCAGTVATGYCDVACVSDVDCAPLSATHRCERGACRAGVASGGSGGFGGSGTGGTDAVAGSGGSSGGSAGSGGSGGSGQACPTGEIAGDQVLLIGDSFFAYKHQVTAYLEDLARNAGALAVGERYRDNSSAIANGLALSGNGILSQYTNGKAESEVKVVIMNGGGADVLIGSCDSVDANCPVLANAVSAARDLFSKMATDGVSQVLYAFYPDPQDATVRAKMDVLRPLIQDACAASAVPCHWVDLRTVFAGRYAEYITGDGLNPTASGASATASAIWSTLQEFCIAQ